MPRAPSSFVGHVTSGGVTTKVAVVQTKFQKFDRFLQRHYTYKQKFHISDPTSSLHTNDVVRFIYNPYFSRSKNVAHTVTEILAPWGPKLHERPPLLSEEERAARRALQIYKRGGDRARALREGRMVLDAAGKLKTVGDGEGWKAFGGVLQEADRLMLEKDKEREGEREDIAWWTDKQGKRRRIQSETMKRVEKMRREAEEMVEKADRQEELRRAEGVDVDKRMEGMRISGGEIAA